MSLFFLFLNVFLKTILLFEALIKSAIFQALAQCENTLTKLGVVREAVDDTAGAAQVKVMMGLCLTFDFH